MSHMRCIVSTVAGNRPYVSWTYAHTALVQASPSSLISGFPPETIVPAAAQLAQSLRSAR